jgi:hypothetical protein
VRSTTGRRTRLDNVNARLAGVARVAVMCPQFDWMPVVVGAPSEGASG